ncbi:MAG TPA: peptidase M15A [Myxococcales bacterium]|jgi:uncharacterized protein YcbK (DUF882 family)|nr:peptidase M15A [Myxococcales bacterium]
MRRHLLPALFAASLFVPSLAQAGRESVERPLELDRGRSGTLELALVEAERVLDIELADPGSARWLRVPGSQADEQPALGDDGLLRAPSEPGIWRLESKSGEVARVVVPVPASLVRKGALNGYRIGVYPARKGAYAPPTGFIEVTRESAEMQVSRSFRLGQFLTKDQREVWPKYLVLDLALVDKLELVLDELRAMGVPASTFHVMSGYRTPQYNGRGGKGRSGVSRHLYGDAADLWIDEDADGQMDDLDEDGRVTKADNRVILEAVERIEERYPELVGGAGLYPANRVHGPFIHIDTRGWRARW